MREFIDRLILFVVGILINLGYGVISDFLIDKYDGVGMFWSAVICIVYLVVMKIKFYDTFIDSCFFDKVLKGYLLIFMPILTCVLLFISGN